jgi:hypothetical protein
MGQLIESGFFLLKAVLLISSIICTVPIIRFVFHEMTSYLSEICHAGSILLFGEKLGSNVLKEYYYGHCSHIAFNFMAENEQANCREP